MLKKQKPVDTCFDNAKVKEAVGFPESSSTKPGKAKYSTRLAFPRGPDFQAHKVLAHREPVALEGEEPMYFRNYAESRVPMSLLQWSAPDNDPTIPRSDADDRDYVRQLITAFRSVENANDAPKSQYIGRLKDDSDFYPPWAIEACAWNILHEVKTIHTEGFKYDKVYDKEMLKAMELTKNLYFDERIFLICRMLEKSKYVAVNLLKDEKLMTTIVAPIKLYNSSMTNCKSNRKRNEWVLMGRAADDTHTVGRKRQRKNGSPTVADKGDATYMAPTSPASIPVLAQDAHIHSAHAKDSQAGSASNYHDINMTDATHPNTPHETAATTTADKIINNKGEGVTMDTKDTKNTKDTTKTGGHGVKSKSRNAAKPGQFNFRIRVPPPAPGPVRTTPAVLPSSSTRRPPARPLMAPPAANTTTPLPQDSQTPATPRPVHRGILRPDETTEAVEAMLLLRSSAYLGVINCRR